MMKTQTAEEIREKYNVPTNYHSVSKSYRYRHQDVDKMLVEFATMHCKAQLEAIKNNMRAEMQHELNGDEYPIVDESSVVNAYPLTNII